MKENKKGKIILYALLCSLSDIVSFFILKLFMDHDSAQAISTGIGIGALSVLIYQYKR
ncbi:hypothetical protein GP475_10345 [Corynebacterium poyangense]|uniref:Uncharacterized protein n=1 Tax=Corynebacterium poyangense TaxID=2684405 RepID=A0A7H0SR11_9CORY|nr:hypothetical protein [Corynebacterium poyangense]MBZ8176406.1 hypothetical protein [Corynebacterium poyangense]QNQ90986.1 hypothetical protein GP475_10345 [Corynebacterium poyangense]